MKVHFSPFEDAEFARLFSKLRQPVASKVAKKLIELASIRNGDSLLDLGCGPGLISRAIMMRRSLSEALLVDSSRKMVETAKRNLAQLNEKIKVKRVNLLQKNLESALGSAAEYDHAIGIDLWHLLHDRRRVLRFVQESLSSKGNLTISLHRESSEKRIREWHSVRGEIREAIKNKLRERYPEFELQPRSKGATVHKDEISSYFEEFSRVGFQLSKEAEDPELADINQMARHLPEFFAIEVRQNFPRVPDALLKKVVNSSTNEILDFHKDFRRMKIATEVFYVFEKSS